MGRVRLFSWCFSKAIPVSEDAGYELSLGTLTLGSTGEVTYLSFNAIAILA